MKNADGAPSDAAVVVADLRARCAFARMIGVPEIAIGVTDDNRPRYHEVIGGVQGTVVRHHQENGVGITMVDVPVDVVERALDAYEAAQKGEAP